MDEGRVRYGSTTWDVQVQRTPLVVVRIMDGEMSTLAATVTYGMLVRFSSIFVTYHASKCVVYYK